MIFGDLGALDRYKIDFHVAAESRVFFSSSALLFLTLLLPPCASLPSALAWGYLVPRCM